MKRYRFIIFGLVIIFSAVALVPVVAFPWKETFSWTKYAQIYQPNVFTVNTTADEVDVNPADGICATASGKCSLRAAVEEANQRGGDREMITIELPAGTYTLSLLGSTYYQTHLVFDRNNGGWATLHGQGAATTIIQGNGSAGVIRINHWVILDGVTVQNGNSNAAGGGIHIARYSDLTVKNSVIRNNKSVNAGGGIYKDIWAYLTLTHSTVSGNQADYGGGLAILDGVARIESSTIRGNTAIFGGGMYVDLPTGDFLVIGHSTISGNTAQKGGGLYIQYLIDSLLLNVTIANNTASVSGGGVEMKPVTTQPNYAIFPFKNTILAGNHNSSSPDCHIEGGIIPSLGYNLIGSSTGCAIQPAATDLVNVDARLGNLRNNGGSTETQALLYGSPAIDTGVSWANPGTVHDQRGMPCPQDGDGDGNAGWDIGAYETVRLYGVFLPSVTR